MMSQTQVAGTYQALTKQAMSMPRALMPLPEHIPWTAFPDGAGGQFKLLNVDADALDQPAPPSDPVTHVMHQE
jgi:hypothetical protein